jgi:hypothetical protein
MTYADFVKLNRLPMEQSTTTSQALANRIEIALKIPHSVPVAFQPHSQPHSDIHPSLPSSKTQHLSSPRYTPSYPPLSTYTHNNQPLFPHQNPSNHIP